MCGIFGEIGGEDETVPIEAISHRGPDGSGVWRDRNVVFGHCRLAVIDVEGGKQPWVEGKRALTFNGEIYNFRELRRDGCSPSGTGMGVASSSPGTVSV